MAGVVFMPRTSRTMTLTHEYDRLFFTLHSLVVFFMSGFIKLAMQPQENLPCLQYLLSDPIT